MMENDWAEAVEQRNSSSEAATVDVADRLDMLGKFANADVAHAPPEAHALKHELTTAESRVPAESGEAARGADRYIFREPAVFIELSDADVRRADEASEHTKAELSRELALFDAALARPPEIIVPEKLAFTSAHMERLRSIDGLSEENWRNGDAVARMSALRELEKTLAEIQGREVMNVRFIEMTGDYQTSRGLYFNKEIRVNEKLLALDSPFHAIETVAHEARHAYQDYAVSYPGFRHPDEAQLQQWRENMRNPLRTGEMHNGKIVTDEEYRAQPCEADAWAYGDQVLSIVATRKSKALP